MKTMKLFFHADCWYNGKLLFKAGETHDVTTEANFAQRWLKRGAVEVTVESVKEIAPVEEVVQVEEVAPVILEQPKPKKFAKHSKKSETIQEPTL